MSHLTEPLSKKRKQSTTAHDAEVPAKKSKIDTKTKKKHKSKDTLEAEFKVVNASLVVSIPPVFANNPRAGVEEMLDSMVMKYAPALRGIVLAHSNLTFLDKNGTIIGDSPFLVCKISFDATVWSPVVGMRLTGKVNLGSPDHISLLVHRTFNVSIPRHHIPTDEWEFEYGPAENDPEFGTDADDHATKLEGEGSGRWVHKITQEKLGGPDGFLEFTVIGLTVANEMLSLLGSIQVDPFSPEHVPQIGPTMSTAPIAEDYDEDAEGKRSEDEDELIDDEEEDTFLQLGRKADAAKAVEMRKALEDDAKKKKRQIVDKEQGENKSGKKSKRKKS